MQISIVHYKELRFTFPHEYRWNTLMAGWLSQALSLSLCFFLSYWTTAAWSTTNSCLSNGVAYRMDQANEYRIMRRKIYEIKKNMIEKIYIQICAFKRRIHFAKHHNCQFKRIRLNLSAAVSVYFGHFSMNCCSIVSCSFRTMSNFFRPFWAKTAFFGTNGDKNILDRPLFILNGIAIKLNSI